MKFISHSQKCLWMLSQVPGTSIPYVTQAASEEVAAALKDCLTTIRSNFRFPAIFVYGASGSGKSRLALHSALALRSDSVLTGYLCLNMSAVEPLFGNIHPSKAEDYKETGTQKASEFLKSQLIQQNLLNEADAEKMQNWSLAAVMKAWADAIIKQDQRGVQKGQCYVCLMVHLDEVQHAAWATACMIRALKAVNKAGLTKNLICAVPIATGLSTSLTQAFTQSISSAQSTVTHLKYFDTERQDDRMHSIVLNVFNATTERDDPIKLENGRKKQSDLEAEETILKQQQARLTSQLKQIRQEQGAHEKVGEHRQPLESWREARLYDKAQAKVENELSELARKLFEVRQKLHQIREQHLTVGHLTTIPKLASLVADTGGWTLGLVVLGVACAAQSAVIPTHPADWDYARVENDTMRLLFRVYGDIGGNLEIKFGLHSEGLPKLIRLVIAPVEVSLCGNELLAWLGKVRCVRGWLGTHVITCRTDDCTFLVRARWNRKNRSTAPRLNVFWNMALCKPTVLKQERG